MNIDRWTSLESSAKFLLLSNLLTILVAIVFHWSILTLLWGYWLQSIFIGLFTVVKHLMSGYRNNNEGFIKTSVRQSIFFTFHYGIFHIGYLTFLFIFLTTLNPQFHIQQPDYIGIVFIGSLFFINHTYSFLKNYVWEKKHFTFSARQLSTEPYKRIFPMHLTIIAAGFFSAIVPSAETPLIIVFLLLKTFADLRSHEILHQSNRFQAVSIRQRRPIDIFNKENIV